MALPIACHFCGAPGAVLHSVGEPLCARCARATDAQRDPPFCSACNGVVLGKSRQGANGNHYHPADTCRETPDDAKRPVCDFTQVPAGRYLCAIDDVRPGTTRAGDERWSVLLTVADGPYVGRMAGWDALVFSIRGRARARMVLKALGLPAKGRVTVEPADLRGRTAFVDVRPAEYVGADGTTVRRNEVPYDGWHSAPKGPACGHSACSQYFIDTGDATCQQGRADR